MRRVAQENHPGHPEHEWRAARQRDLLERHVPGVLLAVAAFESGMAVRNAVVFTGPAQVVIPTLQVVIATLALLGWWRLRGKYTDPERLQWWIGAGLAGLGLLLPLEQALNDDGLLAAHLGAYLILVGGAILGHVVFGLAVVVLVAAWGVAVSTQSSWDLPVDQQASFIMLGLLSGVLIHWNRTADRTALTRRVQETLESGLRDALTGLWNRRGGREVWDVLVAAAQRENTSVWCIFLDVRGLKGVNDRLGHASGDALLKAIANSLVEEAAADVVAARWGGDEFCLFGAGSPPDVRELAASTRAAVASAIGLWDQPWDISPGLSVMPAESGDEAFWRLVDRADDDMYRRRSEGGTVGRSH